MKSILIVEDNEANMYLFSYLFQQYGYNVQKAYSAAEGFETALKEKPDLILMDWQLPDYSGIELTIKLKQNVKFNNCPIIFCTSNVMKGDKEKALQAGASGYIEKPIIPEKVIEEIERHLK